MKADVEALVRKFVADNPAPPLLHGKARRKWENAKRRAAGNEPVPGLNAGVKRRMRFLKRVIQEPIKIKNPDRYLNSYRRRMNSLRGVP